MSFKDLNKRKGINDRTTAKQPTKEDKRWNSTEYHSDRVWLLCENCGCSFGVKKEYADQNITGNTIRCHCGHMFPGYTVSTIIQFEETAPNPCPPNSPGGYEILIKQ